MTARNPPVLRLHPIQNDAHCAIGHLPEAKRTSSENYGTPKDIDIDTCGWNTVAMSIHVKSFFKVWPRADRLYIKITHFDGSQETLGPYDRDDGVNDSHQLWNCYNHPIRLAAKEGSFSGSITIQLTVGTCKETRSEGWPDKIFEYTWHTTVYHYGTSEASGKNLVQRVNRLERIPSQYCPFGADEHWIPIDKASPTIYPAKGRGLKPMLTMAGQSTAPLQSASKQDQADSGGLSTSGSDKSKEHDSVDLDCEESSSSSSNFSADQSAEPEQESTDTSVASSDDASTSTFTLVDLVDSASGQASRSDAQVASPVETADLDGTSLDDLARGNEKLRAEIKRLNTEAKKKLLDERHALEFELAATRARWAHLNLPDGHSNASNAQAREEVEVNALKEAPTRTGKVSTLPLPEDKAESRAQGSAKKTDGEGADGFVLA